MKKTPLKRGTKQLSRTFLRKKSLESQKHGLIENLEKEEKKLQKEKDYKFYSSIWETRPHICQSCEQWLGNELLTVFFDHLLEKEIYTQLRYEEKNIFLCCLECHGCKGNGFPKQKHEEAINQAKRELL